MNTWLLAITRNLAIDALRLHRPAPVDPATLAAFDGAGRRARGRTAPAAAAEVASEMVRLRSALAGLPEEQRRAVVLAALCGRTAQEVGESEGIPLGTAKTRIRTGLLRSARLAGRPREADVHERVAAAGVRRERAVGGGAGPRAAVGPERAAGLSHLAACPSCREQVDELARVADRLLAARPRGRAAGRLRVPGAGRGGVGRRSPWRSARRRPPGCGLRGGDRGPGRRRVGLARRGLVAGRGRRRRRWSPAALRSAGGAEDRAGVRTGLAVSASGRISCRVVVTGARPATVLVSLDGYPGADTDVTRGDGDGRRRRSSLSDPPVDRRPRRCS